MVCTLQDGSTTVSTTVSTTIVEKGFSPSERDIFHVQFGVEPCERSEDHPLVRCPITILSLASIFWHSPMSPFVV